MSRYLDILSQAGGISGQSLEYATLSFYEAGPTSTWLATYQDEDLTLANTNPVVADGDGRFPDIWLQPQKYYVELHDAAGNLLDAQDNVTGSVIGGTAVGMYDTIAEMTAILKANVLDDQQVSLGGYYAVGDGGGGKFYWDSASAATANGGTVIASDEGGTGRWLRIYKSLILQDFGAVGTADDTLAIQAAFDFADSASESLSAITAVFLCEGLTIDSIAKHLVYDFNGSIFKQINTGATVLTFNNRQDVVQNLTILTFDEAASNDVLVVQTTCFEVVFNNIRLGLRYGEGGKWRVGSNGNGGNFWNAYNYCEMDLILDPTVIVGYGASGASINQNYWKGGVLAGLEIVQPTLVPGNQQQFYGNVFENMDCAGGVYVNYYTENIGAGTDSRYFPIFRNMTWEGTSFIGRCNSEASHISLSTSSYAYDQNWPDQHLRIHSSLSNASGDYMPMAAENLLVLANPNSSFITPEMQTDFNGDWEVIVNAAEKAPCGDNYYRWSKTATGQGSPKIVLPKEVLRQGAMFGAISITCWVKAVDGIAGAGAGYKIPAASGSTLQTTNAAFAETDSADAEGWVCRFASIHVDKTLLNTDDDIGIFLSGVNNGITADFYFGGFNVTVGRVAKAVSVSDPLLLSKSVDVIADNATYATAFTITPPTRGSVAYDFHADVRDLIGTATSSILTTRVVVTGYDATVAGTVETPIIAVTNANGSLNAVQAVVSAGTILVQIKLSVWAANPTFPVICTLTPANPTVTLGNAV